MKPVQRYKAWVRANSNLIGAIEGGLSSLTWLLPDRFSDSELSLEGLNTFIGLLSLYHESILQEPAYARDQRKPTPWPFWLGAIQQIEVLVEMAAQSQHKQGRMDVYTPLTLIEAVKAALRAIIIQRSGDRILTDGGMTSSEGPASASPTQTTPEMRAQAVYAAFARFRARHHLGPSRQTSTAANQQAEAAAINMLQHVTATAADSSPTTVDSRPTTVDSTPPRTPTDQTPQAATSDIQSVPSQQSDLHSLANTAAEQGSEARAETPAPMSPVRESSGLSSHPLPPSPGGGSPYWWDLPQDTLWPEEDAQSELESESSVTHTADEKMREVQAAVKQQQALAVSLIKAGELAHICRPLIYVLALRRYGRTSWKPWLLSLAIDIASGNLSSLGARTAQKEITSDTVKPGLSTSGSMLLMYSLQAFKWTPVEQRELTRRKLLMMYYLIRSPFFEQYTRGVVGLALGIVRPVPLVGALADKASEILFGIQQYYTYTSAS